MAGENAEQVGDVGMANAQQVGEPSIGSPLHFDPMEPARPAVAFSLPKAKSSSASRPPLFSAPREVDKADHGSEFVTEFDGKKRVSGQSATIVIPKLENSWRPEKRMKNILLETDLQTIAEADRFEMEAATQEGSQHQYGLTVVKKQADMLTEGETLGSSEVNSSNNQPSVLELDVQRLRQDIEGLPDEASLEAYENVPVEEFGKALLRGMGWETGKPIGRNSKVVAAPLEHVRRYGREGLGAVPAPKTEKVKRYIKPGETRSNKPSMGKIMCVKAGRHIGLRGQIVEIKDGSYTLMLVKGGERISVKMEELAELGSSDEEKATKKLKELRLERVEDGSKHDDGNVRYAGSWANGNDREVHGEKASSGGRSGSHRNDEASVQGRRSRRELDDCQYKEKGHRDKDDGNNDKYASKANDKEDKSRFMSKESSERSERGQRSCDIRSGNAHYKKRDEDRQERKRRDDDYHRHSKHDDSRKDKNVNKKVERDDKDAHSAKDKVDAVHNRERSSEHRHRGKVGSSLSIIKSERNGDQSSASWLVRNIRVRIVDRKLREGRLYLKKGRIVDVISPSICDVLMDETGELVQDVKQAYLETALPKRGGCIIVVGGKHRGQIGKLQDRDTEKGLGLVQLTDHHEVFSLDLENLAEYTGNADEMEL